MVRGSHPQKGLSNKCLIQEQNFNPLTFLEKALEMCDTLKQGKNVKNIQGNQNWTNLTKHCYIFCQENNAKY